MPLDNGELFLIHRIPDQLLYQAALEQTLPVWLGLVTILFMLISVVAIFGDRRHRNNA